MFKLLNLSINLYFTKSIRFIKFKIDVEMVSNFKNSTFFSTAPLGTTILTTKGTSFQLQYEIYILIIF